ncbi:hypothetical protein A0H81_00026 [Grifola frondosa]|uniref:Uncharacterized protein n=1 Tax=Grifola frondosa TaxID=5627 RepID=A0A1C7MP31_GRIFR|nr:hypothetical protein A0H81_00026 [Grifola frondosa]
MSYWFVLELMHLLCSTTVDCFLIAVSESVLLIWLMTGSVLETSLFNLTLLPIMWVQGCPHAGLAQLCFGFSVYCSLPVIVPVPPHTTLFDMSSPSTSDVSNSQGRSSPNPIPLNPLQWLFLQALASNPNHDANVDANANADANVDSNADSAPTPATRNLHPLLRYVASLFAILRVTHLCVSASSNPAQRKCHSTSSPSSPSSPPPRPETPSDRDAVSNSIKWQLFNVPIWQHMAGELYDRAGQCPNVINGHLVYLKLDGYGVRDTVENLIQLLRFLESRPWDRQIVLEFVQMAKGTPTWPRKLQTEEQHVKHAWHLFSTALAFYSFSKKEVDPSFPPVFSGVVQRLFPDPPKGVAKPTSFSFSARELMEEGLAIEPTVNIVEHLMLVDHTIKVLILDSDTASLLLSYDENKSARAVGLGGLGHEWIVSYTALARGEAQENYKLPISLGLFKLKNKDESHTGFDDLTVVTSVIRLAENNPSFDTRPHLLGDACWPLKGCSGSGGAGTTDFGATSSNEARKSPGCSGAPC